MTEAPSGTVTILFTDIAASTSLTEQLGDAEFRQRARELDTLLRTAISEGGGRSVEGMLLGDGVLAVFSSAGRAIECAVHCCALAEGRGLPLHIGLHVGDVLHEGDNVFGGAVNVAARICAASAAGEVLVSDTVRSLARTSVTVRFEDRGQHVLKGIADSLRLFAVRPKEPGGWIDVEARSLRRLWASRAVRVAAAAVLLGVIGGGVAGGLFLSGAVGGGSSAANPYRRIHTHGEVRTTLRSASGSGDCVSTDGVLAYQVSVDTSGEISGSSTGAGELTLYASDKCRWGYSRGTYTLTDQGGNTLSYAFEYPFSAPPVGEGLSVKAAGPPSAIMYTGGTGIYEGATGHGRCVATEAINANNAIGTPGAPSGRADVRRESDCTALIAIGPDVADVEPVILELGAALNRMTVFSSAVDLPKKAYFSVLYMNTRNEPQTGLSLKLRSPEGAEMRAAARDEKDPAAGERVWALPDLAPREVGRFVFSVTFLSAQTTTVDLVAEIDGEGFDPVRSDPLTIEVVQ